MGLIRTDVASTGAISTTGESHLVLPGPQEVDRLALRLITMNPRNTEVRGTMYPRSVWQVGSAGLGSWPDDGLAANPAIIYWYKFLRHENEQWIISLDAKVGVLAGSVWWRWLPGCTVQLEAFW